MRLNLRFSAVGQGCQDTVGIKIEELRAQELQVVLRSWEIETDVEDQGRKGSGARSNTIYSTHVAPLKLVGPERTALLRAEAPSPESYRTKEP